MAIPTVKEIFDLIKTGATIEAQEKIMELRTALLDHQEEIHSLKQKVRELEEQLQIRGAVTFDGSVYWKVEGENRDGPFCQRCYDADRKLIRLQDGPADWWNCLNCKQSHKSKGKGRSFSGRY